MIFVSQILHIDCLRGRCRMINSSMMQNRIVSTKRSFSLAVLYESIPDAGTATTLTAKQISGAYTRVT